MPGDRPNPGQASAGALAHRPRSPVARLRADPLGQLRQPSVAEEPGQPAGMQENGPVPVADAPVGDAGNQPGQGGSAYQPTMYTPAPTFGQDSSQPPLATASLVGRTVRYVR